MDIQHADSNNSLRGLWQLADEHRLTYVGATLAMGLAAAFKAGTYLLLRYFVDNVLAQGQLSREVVFVAVGFIALALLEGGFTFLSHIAAAETAETVAKKLRDYMNDHLMRLTFTYHDQSATGDLIQRATSDIDAIRRFFSEQGVMVGRIILLFIVNFTAVAFLNLRLALLSSVVVPVIAGTSIFFFRKVWDRYEEFQEQEAVLSTVLQENLSGIRVVKAFAQHTTQRDKFDDENWEQFQKGKRLLMMHTVFWPISDILCGLQTLAGLTIGAIMAVNGTITIGTFLGYAGMLVWLIWPMRQLGRVIVQMSVGLVSFERVMTVIKETKEVTEVGDVRPAEPTTGHIVFDGVHFQYAEGGPVLHDISFEVQPGQIVALMGFTGSGKTSVVNLLPRFYEYQQGTITLDGVDLTQYPKRWLRDQIGIVEQEPFLFSRSIRDNIAFGVHRVVSDEEVFAAAKAAAIHDKILEFPEGYDTMVGERGVTLSGGQKQRVAIARTLLKNPRILILDDATSSVDTETEAAIRGALSNLMENRTTFIIAHRIQSVMVADLILMMDQGRIIQRGSHEELMAEEDGIYRRIFEMQARVETDLEQDINTFISNIERRMV